jgi:hypothetical protein
MPGDEVGATEHDDRGETLQPRLTQDLYLGGVAGNEGRDAVAAPGRVPAHETESIGPQHSGIERVATYHEHLRFRYSAQTDPRRAVSHDRTVAASPTALG